MNLLYINHYASLPGNGRGERPSLLAANLIKHDVKTTVVAASFHHLHQQNGVAINRNQRIETDVGPYYFIRTRRYHGNGLKRFLNLIDFRSGVHSLYSAIQEGQCPRPDTIVYSSPHPLAWPAAVRLARRLRVPILLEVRDIWPLSLTEIAGASPWHPFVLWVNKIIKHAYREATAIIGLAPNGRIYMPGVEEDRFHWIPNGVEGGRAGSRELSCLPDSHRQVIQALRKKGQFIIGYAGSMGPPNTLDQVLDLDCVNKGSSIPYHFVFVGDGVSQKALLARTERDGIEFITFLPAIPKDTVPVFLEACDACYLGWKRSPLYAAGISPNKLLDYMMAEKPILHAVETSHDPVALAKAGISVPPYNPNALHSAILSLKDTPPPERTEMGARGRHYVLEHHNWSHLAEQYASVLHRYIEND